MVQNFETEEYQISGKFQLIPSICIRRINRFQLARRLQNRLVFGITDFRDLTDRRHSIDIS